MWQRVLQEKKEWLGGKLVFCAAKCPCCAFSEISEIFRNFWHFQKFQTFSEISDILRNFRHFRNFQKFSEIFRLSEFFRFSENFTISKNFRFSDNFLFSDIFRFLAVALAAWSSGGLSGEGRLGTFCFSVLFWGSSYFNFSEFLDFFAIFTSCVSGMVFRKDGLLFLWLFAPGVTSWANLLLDFRDPSWRPQEPTKSPQGPTWEPQALT